jgi:hypothetical protein
MGMLTVLPWRPLGEASLTRVVETSFEKSQAAINGGLTWEGETSEVPRQGRWHIYGLGLPDDVLEKVYLRNAAAILGLELAE